MSDEMNRRRFVRRGLSLGAGAALVGALPREGAAAPPDVDPDRRGAPPRQDRAAPLIITSHGNDLGRSALQEAWAILDGGGSALDAVERGANLIEVDPDDTSVGYGGLPNEEGVIQLDASIMDGATYNAGSVSALEGIMTPSSVARLVMERTDHVMLVAEHAQRFALDFGFELEDLMTERTRQIWLRWRQNRSDGDDWGPPDHLRDPDASATGGQARARFGPEGLEAEGERWAELLDLPGRHGPDRAYVLADALLHRYGTTNVLAVDAAGNVSGITTTSGLAWKIPGRIGDSPIIGAGLYVDNEVGAAGVTGRGEDVIKSCASYYIVSRMAAGRTPQQACEDAAAMIKDKYRSIGNDFVPREKFVAIDKGGDYGCAWMPFLDSRPRMAVANAGGISIYEGVSVPD